MCITIDGKNYDVTLHDFKTFANDHLGDAIFLQPFFLWKNGITEEIICKSFEVMKSYIIIFFVDCNTHLHSLNKKKLFFEYYHFPQKQRGRSPSGGETKFFGQTEISGRWGGRVKKLVSLAGIFTDLSFELKSKKLSNFKDGQFGTFEKHGCPPPLWNELPHKANFYLAWVNDAFIFGKYPRQKNEHGISCVPLNRH